MRGGLPRPPGVDGWMTWVHRGRCALRCVGNVSALQLRRPSSDGRGVEDAAPYGGCVWVRFSGAVRWARSLDVVPAPVASYAARPVSLSAVRGGVLDAPRLRDRRGAVDADVERDRLYPRFQRCARLHPPPHVSYPAGTARAPLVRRNHVVDQPSPAARKRTGPRTGPFFGMTQVLSITTPSTTSATFSQASAQSSRYL